MTFPKRNKKYGQPPTNPCQNLAINCFAISRLWAKRRPCKRVFSSVRPAAARRFAVWRKSGPPWRHRRKARHWSCSRPNRPRSNSNASCSPPKGGASARPGEVKRRPILASRGWHQSPARRESRPTRSAAIPGCKSCPSSGSRGLSSTRSASQCRRVCLPRKAA